MHPNDPWTVREDNIMSKCGWSPFTGHVFKSRVHETWVNGTCVWDGRRSQHPTATTPGNASPSTADGMKPLRILTAVTLVVFIGCAPEAVDRDPQVQPPEGVMDRVEFVRVLTEIQMVEAVSDLRTFRNDNEKQRLAEAYNDVWQRTGVSGNLRSRDEWWWAPRR